MYVVRMLTDFYYNVTEGVTLFLWELLSENLHDSGLLRNYFQPHSITAQMT